MTTSFPSQRVDVSESMNKNRILGASTGRAGDCARKTAYLKVTICMTQGPAEANGAVAR
jgi:hypothetical protein